jgi:hypothetical protein
MDIRETSRGTRCRTRCARGRATRAALTGVVAAAIAAGGTAAPALAAAPTAQTAAAPAPTGGLTAAAAEALVRSHGYTPVDTSGYDPSRALSVIIGILSGSADGHPQQAFFFHNGHYVGTDTAEPSATESWVWSTGDTVAIQYQLYRPDDPMCCPSAGAATVRFRWSGGSASPLDTVPTTSWGAVTSRR